MINDYEHLAEFRRVNEANREANRVDAQKQRPDNISDDELLTLHIYVGDPSQTPKASKRTNGTRIWITEDQRTSLKRRTDLDHHIERLFKPSGMRELVALANDNPAFYRVLNYVKDRAK